MSSRKKRNKNDTWKADELENSIKNALLDKSEKHRHAKSKKQIKEEPRKGETDEEFVTREKLLREDQLQRSHGKAKARTPSRDDEKNQLQQSNRLERIEINKKSESRKDKSARKEQEERNTSGRRTLNEVDGDKEFNSAYSCTPDGSDEDDYEDDFEEYEDDFEDITGHDSEGSKMEFSEVAALGRAIKEENEATLRRSQETSSTSSRSSALSRPTTSRSRQAFINFTAAKQRQINTKAYQRTMQRGVELLNLIELDVSTCSLFEILPVKVYELYIKCYGRSNTKQAFAQCHEDILDRDIQTETIEMRDSWTQHPCEVTSAVNVIDRDDGAREDDSAVTKVNSLRLSLFLEKAGQVMNALLEESGANGRKSKLRSNHGNIVFSEGYTRLNSELSFLKGRYVTHTQFHPVQTNLLLAVYSRPKGLDENSSPHEDILCVWNVNDSSQPYRILTCKSKVNSCCFSPIKSTYVFAGTSCKMLPEVEQPELKGKGSDRIVVAHADSGDGAVLVWDLREPSSMHTVLHCGDLEWLLRVPTYSTYGAHTDEKHHSAVIKVLPIITSEDNFGKAALPEKSEEIHGLSFQLASLDEQGVIHFWVVIDLDQTHKGGSETDLGLVPSGKVKLLRSSCIVLDNPSRCKNMSQAMQAMDMKFSLKDSNQFYVATDSGNILHGNRHGDRVSPRCYRKYTDTPVGVIQLDISPFDLPCFLAATADGDICLYSLTLESPLITWSNSTGDMPIISIAWSHSRPSVFYVVDITSKVYVWELLVNPGGPTKTEQFTNGRLIAVELSSDHTATGRGQLGRAPAMVITDDRGAVDVHTLNQQFSKASDSEMEQMVAFLNTFQ